MNSAGIRLGIAARMGLLLACVGMGVAAVTGFYAYQASRDLLVNSAKEELLAATQVLARRITLEREEISRNLTLLTSLPDALAMLQKPGPVQASRLGAMFRALMQTNPGYFQIRLISSDAEGLERVRVDRDLDGPLVIAAQDMQEKGHYPYVFEALKLPAGQTYLSRIVINHESGAHAGLNQPSAVLAMPVRNDAGVAQGVVVINVDLKGWFTQMAAEMPKNQQLFLMNQSGDFLIHPDPALAFGFDRGRRILVQDEFAQTADLVSGQIDSVVLEARSGRYAQAPVVAAFLGRKVVVSSAESGLIVGVAQPLSTVVEDANALGWVILKIVAVLCAGCLLLAALLARAVARPIHAMSVAVQKYAQDRSMLNLPIHRSDEVGELARSFDQMQNQIGSQLHELQQSRRELEHLALHDTLTGLPNRRFFYERLDHVLARARRGNTSMALLFVDLDFFKKINDDIGHDAGDAVLKAVGARLVAAVREVDTVARIGGDEFVVLLDDPKHRDQVAIIAVKLLESLRSEIPFNGHVLHIGASIGISQYPYDGKTATEILASADRAMYAAKAHGRNSFRFAS